MGALADMLAAHGDGDDADMEADPERPGDGSDAKAMAVASVKAFFEAGKGGDYEAATEHLAAAMEHCESYEGDDGADGGGGHAALLVMPHGGKK